MTSVAVRLFAFSVLPFLLAMVHVRLTPSGTERLWRNEVFLIYMFVLGVGAGGLSGFVGHVLVADEVAESIGWGEGSPFQQEMGVSNLALGILGFVAAQRRDGFREATVVALTVVAVGVSVVHAVDIVSTGNLAPGNSIQIIGNLTKPALLIPLLLANRRAELESPLTPAFEEQRMTVIRTASLITGVVGTCFGIGYWLELVLPSTMVATLVAAAISARAGRVMDKVG